MSNKMKNSREKCESIKKVRPIVQKNKLKKIEEKSDQKIKSLGGLPKLKFICGSANCRQSFKSNFALNQHKKRCLEQTVLKNLIIIN